MDILIKSIREYLGITILDLARILEVSPKTVNNWENNITIPSKTIQKKLYELSISHKIPLGDILLYRINTEVNKIKLPANKVLLYHGSKSGIVGNIKPISRELCDFGSGFYMGTKPSQVLTLVSNFKDSKLYILSMGLENLAVLNIPVGIDWAMIVAYNRGKMEAIKGSEFYNKYKNICVSQDVIIGCIADDRMFYVIDEFFKGNITDKALVNSLSALKLGKQYTALTTKACSKIVIEKEIPLYYIDRLILQDISKYNRQQGINLANAVCRDSRRDGLYFDEILQRG